MRTEAFEKSNTLLAATRNKYLLAAIFLVEEMINSTETWGVPEENLSLAEAAECGKML